MKKLLIFLTLFTILFISSGQTYEQQTLIPAMERYFPSEPFKGFLTLFQIPYWGMTISVEERGYYPFVEFVIRKASHVVIFGLIALADEFHQSLTGGRTPTGQDVLLDVFGAVLFLGAAKFLKKNKKEFSTSIRSLRAQRR